MPQIERWLTQNNAGEGLYHPELIRTMGELLWSRR
jgi:hypothetical protein